MKLTKISARDFKGLSFDLDLSDVNVLVGANFVGKTARIDAIRLLLLGHLPELGKTNKATFGLASAREMIVWGVFDDGSSLQRSWRAEGDSIRAAVTTESPKVLALLKNQSLAVMLDAETYFALSDRERVNYVFANVPLGADLAPGTILDGFNLWANRTFGGDAKRLSSSAKLIGKLVEVRDDAKNAQEFVERALLEVDLVGKSAKEHAIKMEKTTQGLAALRAGDKVKPIDFAELDARRTELNKEILELHERKGKVAADADAEKANDRRRRALQVEIAGKESLTKRIEATREGIAAKTQEIETIPMISDADVHAIRLDEREADVAAQAHRNDLKNVDLSIASNEAELRAMGSLSKCPYCGAEGEGWKITKGAEIGSALSGLRIKREQLERHVQDVTAARVAIGNRLREAINDQNRRRALADSLKDFVNSEKSLATSLESIARAEHDLAEIPNAGTVATNALNEIDGEIRAANAELGNLDLVRKNADARAADVKRLAQAENERDEAKVDQEVAAEAAGKLREIQADLVEAAFAPLLRIANEFFSDVLPTPIAYNAGEIGTWRDGVWVGHRTFSGTEKLLCYAAIQAALASASPVRIMILDELGRVDAANLEKIFAGISRSILNGSLDQFVGIAPGSSGALTVPSEPACQVVRVG